jgi:hypothetical protein
MCLSYLYGTGELEKNVLNYLRDYVRSVPVDVGWNLVFSSIEPYFHLFRSDIEEFQLFGSWMLAHVSRTGNFIGFILTLFSLQKSSLTKVSLI